jgi:hypothetical protein
MLVLVPARAELMLPACVLDFKRAEGKICG